MLEYNVIKLSEGHLVVNILLSVTFFYLLIVSGTLNLFFYC